MKERQLDISIYNCKNIARSVKPIKSGTSNYNPLKSACRTVSNEYMRDLKPKHFSGKRDLGNNGQNHDRQASVYTDCYSASLETNQAIGADNFNNSYNKIDLSTVSDIISGNDLRVTKDQCYIRGTRV